MSDDSSQPARPAAETEQQSSPPPRFEPGESPIDATGEKLAEAIPRFEPDESLIDWAVKHEPGPVASLQSFLAHLSEPEAERKADEQT